MRIQACIGGFMLFMVLPLHAQQPRNIVINEFLTSNVSTNADIVDFDDFSDWIELYNAGDTASDIGGYFITDSPTNRFKWKFPAGTILPAKGFLLVWADGYNEVPGRLLQRPYYPYDPFTTRYFHLNFKLDRAGEFIGLVGPDSLFIDSLSFTMQENDISVGRKPDGSANWLFFGEPTPSQSNATPGVSTVEYAGIPDVSPASGFSAGSQTVTMSAPSGIGEVRYTLDGSKPSSTSSLYTSPLSIDTTTVLKARTFRANAFPSPVVTRTFFINESSTLPVMSLSTPPALLWDPQSGIYQNNAKNREIPTRVEFFAANKTPGFDLDVSLALSGQASLRSLSIGMRQNIFRVSHQDRYC